MGAGLAAVVAPLEGLLPPKNPPDLPELLLLPLLELPIELFKFDLLPPPLGIFLKIKINYYTYHN